MTETTSEIRKLGNSEIRNSQAQPTSEVPEFQGSGSSQDDSLASSEVPKFRGSGSSQQKIATASFIAAVAFSVAGFCVPPLGDLTEANLYLVAQFLLVTTSIFGVSSIVSKKPPTDSPEGERSSQAVINNH